MIGVQCVLTARQGGYQHDQGGLGEVKICDQRVQHFEAIPRIDKNIRPSRALGHGAVLRRKALDGAAGGGAHTDHPASISFGFIDNVRGLLRYHAELGVHLVVTNILRLEDVYKRQG